MNEGIVASSRFPIVGVPIAGLFVIILSLSSQNKYQEEIKKLSPPLTNPLIKNQFGYQTTNGYINSNPTALYPSADDMMNQKPVTNVYNPNTINNIYHNIHNNIYQKKYKKQKNKYNNNTVAIKLLFT